MSSKGNTTDRGYGHQHNLIRRAELAQLRADYAKGIKRFCLHCGNEMRPDQDMDLDHNTDRTGYRGLVHASCNRSAGATEGNAARLRKHSREW